MGDRIKEEIIGWMKTLLMAAILAGVINSFLIVNAQVPTSSMENTIMAGDRAHHSGAELNVIHHS